MKQRNGIKQTKNKIVSGFINSRSNLIVLVERHSLSLHQVLVCYLA